MINILTDFISNNGLIILFIEVLISSLGFPGGTVTIISFGSVSGSYSTLLSVILVAYLAAILGDLTAYFLARRYSHLILNTLRRFSFYKDNEQKSRDLLNKYGFYLIFITRFGITGICAVISYISGMEKINRKKFITAVLLGEFLFAIIYASIGFAVGNIITNLLSAINDFIIVIILIILLFLIIGYYIKKKRKKRNTF